MMCAGGGRCAEVKEGTGWCEKRRYEAIMGRGGVWGDAVRDDEGSDEGGDTIRGKTRVWYVKRDRAIRYDKRGGATVMGEKRRRWKSI